MRVLELKALAREHRLRGYLWMRRAELIELIQNDQRPLHSWGPRGAMGGQGTPELSQWCK